MTQREKLWMLINLNGNYRKVYIMTDNTVPGVWRGKPIPEADHILLTSATRGDDNSPGTLPLSSYTPHTHILHTTSISNQGR